ncbi:hypothetical protein BDV28DRAFT_132271 [Aspergillus coremiiformis]|uniref:Uncharacterized protein n=1 Tax=Aspergillus coremiiformis TaxID=138285 RepID=A0A5N6ZCT4_9EURO|nr:hypothetical protein BDV28DRAFT_132271 [Aspergillus coremiiformis]
MARLCVPGFPFRASRPTPRFTTQPAFRSFPQRVVYRENPPVTPRSLLPVSPGVHSFSTASKLSAGNHSFVEMRKGSHLPIRSVRAPSPPSAAAPASSGAAASLNGSLSRLSERRAARQARPRPWAQPRSTSRNQSLEGHLSTPAPRRPAPANRSIQDSLAIRIQRTIARIDAVLAKPVPGRKDAPVRKRVRFGETTVATVSRWIERPRHVFVGVPSSFGHLQGWSVTPLPEPDKDGELEKYVSYWGSDSYIMLTSAHKSGPCGQEGCAWNSLARLWRRHPMWTPPMVFKGWLAIREMRRKKGVFAL